MIHMGRFDICLVVAKTVSETPSKNPAQSFRRPHGTAAIDPGVLSPFVIYDVNGGVIDIGCGDIGPHLHGSGRRGQARLRASSQSARGGASAVARPYFGSSNLRGI